MSQIAISFDARTCQVRAVPAREVDGALVIMHDRVEFPDGKLLADPDAFRADLALMLGVEADGDAHALADMITDVALRSLGHDPHV